MSGRGGPFPPGQLAGPEVPGEVSGAGLRACPRGGSPCPCVCAAVRQVRLVRGLQAVEVSEQDTVSMEVELSHDNVEGGWTRDGLRLQPGLTCQLAVHGPIHTLTLSELRPQDGGLIAFKAEGVHTSAWLTVTGAWARAGPRCRGGLGRWAGTGWWTPGGRALGLIPRASCVIPPSSGPPGPALTSHLPPTRAACEVQQAPTGHSGHREGQGDPGV